MNHGWPDEPTLRAALTLAVRAPSVHNTQPWRFRISDHHVDLHLDPTRANPLAGTEQRDAVLSCGAALHHLRIALAAAGWSAVVHRLPNPADPNHLASIELVPHRPTMLEHALSGAILRRQTDRRSFSSAPIPPGYLGLVKERATTLGANVRQAADATRERLVEALRTAPDADAGYRLELADWSGRPATPDGVSAHSIPLYSHPGGVPGIVPVPRQAAPDFAELLVLGTSTDDRLAQLCAGEALSAVLLTATNVGLATCALTEPLEIPELRQRIRVGVLDDLAYPQAVIRIGWASAAAAALPFAPRRALADVLDPFEPAAC
ncbi:Acg family FMN-binding oxidoreductase [Nocardia sp. NPDC051052]|uniref:Acg family FMN-binding oxidoreductase n=1 Tax=Nocardia sp. NPDC051052 TaxID=3364322 RepID=UPI0037A84352